MPGIVGLITRMPHQQAEAELSRMMESMRHESFYVTGTWNDPDLGVYVGWTARRGSFADGMPLRTKAGGLVLVFSGEEFSDYNPIRSFKERGHEFENEGPSFLVRLADEDRNFPLSLNGRFHGVLADRIRNTVTVFNDRYGMHRAYYHQWRDAFYFAAEAKAILKVRPELRKFDSRSLGEFITCGCVLENRSLFDGIHVLPPASAWRFRSSTLEKQVSYFDPKNWEEQPVLEPEAYYQELRRVFSQRLPRYFNGCEPVAMSLTGGLDTRLIMAWQKSAPGSLACYSFGGMVRESQDVTVARRVAQSCGQTHRVIPVGQEFLTNFQRYAERAVYLTDGCIDVRHSPDLYVNERAKDIAPVRMTGNYGSEVLRRVRAFKPGALAPGLISTDLRVQLDLAASTYAEVVRAHPLSFAVFRQAPWHHYGLLCLEQTQLSIRSPFLDNDLVRTVFRAPQSLLSQEVSQRLIADGNPQLAEIPSDRGPIGLHRGLGSLAIRSARDLSAKFEYAYDYGMPQWVARIDHLFSGLHIERLFLGRNKFYHFRTWYRDALATFVRATLLDSRTLSRPYLQRHKVEEIVAGHLAGTHNYTTEIHKLLTLELISKTLLESN